MNAYTKGTSSLEIMATLALSIPIFLVLMRSLHSALITFVQVKLEADVQSKRARLQSLLHSMAGNLDRQRLEISPRLHPAGVIKFTDDSDNQVMRARVGPKADSDAITSLRLDMRSSLDVVSGSAFGLNATFIACKRYEQSFQSNQYRSFVGVHLGGLLELAGRAKKKSERCFELNLQAGKSMSISKQRYEQLANVRLLVPIESHYTIYLAADNQVRLASHVSAENIENQPLMLFPLDILFQIQARLESGVTFIDLLLQGNRQLGSVQSFNNLKRESILDVVLNRS